MATAAVGSAPGSAPGPAPGRARIALGSVGALVAGVGVATAVAGLVGGATRAPLLGDPGPLVRWGLLLGRGIGDLAAAAAIGALVLAAVALPVHHPGPDRPTAAPNDRPATRPTTRPATRPRAHPPALLLTAAAASVWALGALSRLVLGYAEASGQPFSDPGFGSALGYYATRVDPGRQSLATLLIAAVVAVLAAAATTTRATGLLAVLAIAGLVPAALAGHAAGSSQHETAVTAVGLHLVGVSLWVGGLAALVGLRRSLDTGQLATATRRFSSLATWALVAVVGSGLVSAGLRLGGWSGLAGRYGLLVLVKTGLLVGLLVAGRWQRRRALPALVAGDRRAFGRIAAVELAMMAMALGAGAALARSEPPVPQLPPALPSPAQSLTGYPLPPQPSALHWLTVWRPDLWWLLIAAVAVGLYLAGLRRLRRRADRWSPGRTVCWLFGVAALVFVTSGPPAAYGRVLFSGHMIGHLAISMLVPPLLVLGAPITLALRTLPARTDGSLGAREWLLGAVHSRVLQVAGFAPVAAALFAGSLIAFYYTDLFGLALRTHLGHQLMLTHFLLAGYLFAWVLIGIDPGPRRPAHPLRLILLLATAAFHAFFAVTLMSASTVLQADYFAALGRDWGTSLLADQRLGGGIAWAMGELPTLALVIILVAQWARQDDRDSRRQDRAAALDGEAELVAYNQMLRRLAGRSGPAGRDLTGLRDSNGG